MNELRNKLIKFREITLNIIDSLEKEDYDTPEKLLGQRDNIIKEINNLNYKKKSLKNRWRIGTFINRKETTKPYGRKKAKIKQKLKKLQRIKKQIKIIVQNNLAHKIY